MGPQSIGALWRSEDGVTAIEYALIAGLVCLVIISAVTLVGSQLAGTFNAVANGFGNVAGP